MGTNIAVRDEKFIGKLPPQSIEAEEAILGAILTNPSCINKIVDMLKVNSFYKPANKIIYQTILDLIRENSAIDIVTVSEKLKELDKLELVGGRIYINELAMNVVTTANVEYYAKIVQEKAIKRNLINAGSEIVTMSYESNSIDETLDTAQKMIFSIAQQKVTSDLVHVKDIVTTTYQKIEERFNNRDELLGYTTGFYDLDKMMSGLQPSDLLILAARPAMGKTAFVLNIALNVAKLAKVPVTIFSLEMSKEQLLQRLLCAEAEVDMQKVKSGNMQAKDWERLLNAMTVISETPIYIDDTPGATIMDIRAKCRRVAMEEKKLGLIVIDYLQLMEGGGNEERTQQVSAISRGLQGIARELNVPIIALSQLSRAVEQRNTKKPMLSDLRESGSIEQDADIVMFIYREDYYDQEETENKGNAEIIIAKHRNGPTGSVDLLFQPNITKFKNKTAKTAVF